MYIRLLLLWLLPSLSFAARRGAGIGSLASDVMEPVQLANNVIGTACLVVGIGFIFASLVKYIEHRRSPLMVPLSTVVFLFIAGVILALLPFLPLLIGTGVPYTVIKW